MTDVDADPILQICADLKLTLGGLRDEMTAARRNAELARRAEQPRLIRLYGNVILPASGFGVIHFTNTSPDQGHLWMVRQLVVGGLTPTTVAAGRADVFVTETGLEQVTSLAQIGLQAWRDQAATLPLVGPYGKGELPVHSEENLYVIISGGTVGQQYVACGQVEDYQESAMSRQWGL